MANGVAKIFPSQSFTIRLVNTSMNIRRLPMWMVLGHALPHATAMAALIEDLEVVKVPGTSTTPQSGSLKDFTAGDYGQEREEVPPMEYGLQRYPPPLPDRPDVEGDAWREAVQLGHL
jgi:hypothetical protein